MMTTSNCFPHKTQMFYMLCYVVGGSVKSEFGKRYFNLSEFSQIRNFNSNGKQWVYLHGCQRKLQEIKVICKILIAFNISLKNTHILCFVKNWFWEHLIDITKCLCNECELNSLYKLTIIFGETSAQNGNDDDWLCHCGWGKSHQLYLK